MSRHTVLPLGHCSAVVAQQRRAHHAAPARRSPDRPEAYRRARPSCDRHAERSRPALERPSTSVRQPPTMNRAGGVALSSRRWLRSQTNAADSASRVVMECVHAGRRGEQIRGASVAVVGDPRAEVLVDGAIRPAQSQTRRDQGHRRCPMDRTLVMESIAGQLRSGDRRHQIAFAQPVPQRAALVDRMRPEVCLIPAVGAARPSAEFVVCLKQAHGGARSAHVIAAVSPATPPPMMVISCMGAP